MTLDLPFPPSVNHYWVRNRNGSVRISNEGQAFRLQVVAICRKQRVKPLAGRLAVVITLFPPDRRRRDLDNVLKAALDALQHGGCYADDSQIDHLAILRSHIERNGKMRVIIQEIVEDED